MLERKTFSKIGLSLFASIIAVNVFAVAAVVVFFVVSVFRNMAGGSVDIADLSDRAAELLSSGWFSVALLAIGDLIIILVVWLFVRKLPKAPARPIEPGSGGKWAMVFSIFCICMALVHILAEVGWFVNSVLQGLFPVPVYESTSPISAATDYSELVMNFVMACMIAPVAEEIIFRKLVLTPLRAFGDTAAILFSGIAFGLFHQNFEQMFYAAAIGILLGYAYIRTNRLWVPITIHFMVNFMGGIVPSMLDMWLPDRSNAILCGMIVAFWIIGGGLVISLRKKIVLEPAPFRFSVPITAKLAVGNVGVILFTVLCLGLSLFMALLPGLTNI